MANKRIRDLSERTTFSSGDYLATDNSSGTRKVDASKILTPISTAQSTADLVQSEVATSNDEFSKNKGYKVGDLVVAPDDKLIYRCKTAYSTGASWASRKANFEHVTMLEAVDSLNAALTPIDLTLTSVLLNDYKAKKYGKLVNVCGLRTYASAVSNVNEVVGILPSGARPPENYVRFSCSSGATSSIMSGFVDTDGNIHLAGSASGGAYVSFNFSFLL